MTRDAGIGTLLTQTWTADGLRASLTDAAGNTAAFAYDGFNRLATTTYPSVGGVSRTETLTYDSDSNVTKRCTRAGLPIGSVLATTPSGGRNRHLSRRLSCTYLTMGDSM